MNLMFLNIILILAGFMLLIKGADYLVDGASSIARRFGISSLIIGLTVVAFGTSAPELAVNILSASLGNTALAFGNINGSNIANILLILGTTGLIATIPVKSRTVAKEIPFMVLAGFVLIVLTLDGFLDQSAVNQISRIDGILLLSFFGIFLYYLFLSSKEVAAAKKEKPKYGFWSSISMTIGGLAGLIIGGYLAVEGASDFAIAIGISEALVGLTIVAIGTSLPELVASIIAAKKGETDLAIGGVVGSNIFNILLVLGASSTISPILIEDGAGTDAIVAFGAMMVLMMALFFSENKKTKVRAIGKKEAAIFLILYILYIVYIILRG